MDSINFVGPSRTLVQPKPIVGPVGDSHEREADRVARQVVGQINSPTGNALQREEAEEEEESIQPMREAGPAGGPASPQMEQSIRSAKGGGQPMDQGIRRSMERAFGADFSGVRVHSGSQADRLNRSLQAKAFTTGRDIFFRQGAYTPAYRGGQELLAHELTHVVQQNSGLRRSPRSTILESAAANIQRRMAKGGSDEVRPEFSSGKDAHARIIWEYGLRSTQSTVGIGTQKVCDDAGKLWAADAPEGKERIYKSPQNKGKPRGWQANYWERPKGGGKNTHNFHVSMY